MGEERQACEVCPTCQRTLEKKGVGRPSKYKPEFCQQLIEFFDVEPYKDVELPHYGKNGEHKWTDFKRMANKLPTLRNFAKSINIGITTIYEWVDKEAPNFQKEFAETFTRAKEIRKWFLIENGLNGCYNPAFAIFTAKNITDMRDKQEFTGPDGGPVQLIIKTATDVL